MRLTKNTFEGGRNTDTNKSLLQPNQYLEAHNLDLVADGSFFALRDINGTEYLKEIINDSTAKEIGAFYTRYLISGSTKNCITYFTVTSTNFNIWCYDIDSNQLYALYQEAVVAGFNTTDRVVDAINYPENGVDVLYFTDNFNEMRYLKCEIPSPYTANFLTKFDISLQRKGAVGNIALTSVGAGGNLLSGTYQFAYRTCDPVKKKFTKWSSITNPVHVYDADNSSNIIHAGIGVLTNRKITLTITPSATEASNLGFIQLAIIENVASTPPTEVSLSEFLPYTVSLVFDYKSNTRIGTISLDDLTVDQAQIQSLKSLRVSNNRLLGGNIKYTDLQPTILPTVVSGSVVKRTSSFTDPYAGDDFSSNSIGYFRNEVYRFGVVYEDENGNKSQVTPLDLSGVTNNQITAGIKDMKFPDRSLSNSWTLFDNSGKLQSLGLNLTVRNSVPWAKKMHVVRVARKKDILFQTPIIPMMSVNGIGALGNYPSSYFNTTISGATPTTSSSAQPQTASRVLIPKNMLWPEKRNIELNKTNGTLRRINEATLAPEVNLPGYQFSMIWPSPNMYGDEPFVFTGSEKVDFIDRVLLKLNVTEFNPIKSPLVDSGDDLNTNITASFYGLNNGDYFFDSTWSAKSITNKDIAVVDYEYFDNFGQPASVSGVSTLDYAALQTKGVDIGFQPSVQRSAVINMATAISDINNVGAVFANGTLNAFFSGGNDIVQGTGIKYEPVSAPTNTYVNKYSGFSNGSYVSACTIANVKLGLSDDRYGDLSSFQSYQYTGASYVFSNSDIATMQSGGNVDVNLDVFGGDCFVAPHTFKICDSTYSVVNQKKNMDLSVTLPEVISKWKLFFRDDNTNTPICLPVALENVGQYLTVILESEYNGGVLDFDVLQSVGNVNGIPILNNTNKDTIRTPLTYRYNLNLSRQNSQKVFTSKLKYSFKQNKFGARVAYTDIKIYNSDQAGFDVWKVADFIDLPEQRYDITKLVSSGDNLYAIQEKGIVYLPIGERQVEQTDTSTLSIRTGDVIGRPLVIDSQRGSQHLRGIVETGNTVYIPDNLNKSVYLLGGTELKDITEDNQTLIRTLFDTTIDGQSVKGLYDWVNNQYWLIAGGKTNIFNERGIWVGDYEFEPFSAVYTKEIYVTGKEGNSLRVYSLTSPSVPVTLFGQTVIPRLTICINPDENFSKTFDVLMLASTERLLSGDIVVENDSLIGNQSITGINFDIEPVEGNYRIPVPRDSNGYRARGLRALLTIKWKAIKSSLQGIYTKYDLSKRTPF